MQSKFRLGIYAVALAGAVGCIVPVWAAETGHASPKIIGGEPVPAGQNTYQVALLQSRVADNYKAQFCGGTLIDRSWVVTAAHCVEGQTAVDIQVLAGTNKLDGSGVRHPVNSITVHPRYCGRRCNNDFDVAVLHLGTSAASNLDTARLMKPLEEKRFAAPGDLAVATGWGNTSTGAENFPQTLQSVKVPVVAQAECNSEQSYDGVITRRMLCAGLPEGGKDSCQGDSGGPLAVKETEKGKAVWILAGITSWGSGCAQPDLYGIYSRISVLRNWILGVIDSSPY